MLSLRTLWLDTDPSMSARHNVDDTFHMQLVFVDQEWYVHRYTRKSVDAPCCPFTSIACFLFLPCPFRTHQIQHVLDVTCQLRHVTLQVPAFLVPPLSCPLFWSCLVSPRYKVKMAMPEDLRVFTRSWWRLSFNDGSPRHHLGGHLLLRQRTRMLLAVGRHQLLQSQSRFSARVPVRWYLYLQLRFFCGNSDRAQVCLCRGSVSQSQSP